MRHDHGNAAARTTIRISPIVSNILYLPFNCMWSGFIIQDEERCAVCYNQEYGNAHGIEVLVSHQEKANIYKNLQQGIASRYIEVRDIEIVGQCFIKMLPVRFKYILAPQHTLEYRKPSIRQKNSYKDKIRQPYIVGRG